MKKIFKIISGIFIFLNFVIINHAYKFTHFYEHGTTKSIAEQTNSKLGILQVALFGLKQEKLSENKPDTIYTDIKLKTKEGFLLDAWLIKVPNSKGTVAMFHGIGSEKSANLTTSETFNQFGYSTLLVDFCAHGLSEGNTCTIGYKEAEDVDLAYNYLKNHGEKNILLYGISLGAATVTKAISDYKLSPSKVILEMPYASLPETVEGKVKMTGIFSKPIGNLLTFWGGAIHGFWAFDMKPKEFVKKIKCPVLLQWGRLDQGVKKSEIDEIFKNISAPKKLVIYEKSGHQNLCENENEKWEENVEEFLNGNNNEK